MFHGMAPSAQCSFDGVGDGSFAGTGKAGEPKREPTVSVNHKGLEATWWVRRTFIALQDDINRTIRDKPSFFQPKNASAKFADLPKDVGSQYDRLTAGTHLMNTAQAFFLEFLVGGGKHLINQKNI